MNRKEIESKAIDTLQRTEYEDSSDYIDAIDVAKKLGFVVGNAVLEKDVDGFILINEGADNILGIKTDKLIGVNSAQELAWKRFIIAHEIGHYVLHYNKQKDKGMYAHRDHKKGKDDVENEADFFAANLLMPRDKFMEKYKELQEKHLSKEDMIILLANKFIVTKPMVERRFKELGLIGE